MQNLIHQSENKISLEDNSFFDDTNKKQLSLILQSNLISKENVCIPYWNTKCDDIQSTLWLPHKTVLKNQDLTLLNYQEEKPNYWQTIIKPKQVLEKNNLSSLLQPSVIVINENKSNQDINVITTKKIRIFPENLKAYKEALDLHRRSYNLAMSNYIDNTYIDEKGNIKNLRPEIRNVVKKESTENNTMFSSIIADNGVLEAKKTFLTVCKNNKNNKGNKTGFSSLKYKSKKGTIHSFKIDRLPFSGIPNIKELGKIHITEEIPQEAFRKTCIITCDKNRWYMNVQQITLIKAEIQGQVKCVSVDQGVRTFATTYSPDEVAFIGDDFAKNKLFPLMKEVDNLISQKQKLLNSFKDIKFIDLPQWTRDRIIYIDKRINNLKCRKEDLINDLHHKFANYLLTNFDCVFLPHFKTKEMVKRKGKVRTIRRNTARQMLDLNHYKFKVILKWLAKKYGKIVIDCDEAYTSKTRSWNGSIDDKLGSKKIIKDNNIIVHRDINGARGIFIKCLTREA